MPSHRTDRRPRAAAGALLALLISGCSDQIPGFDAPADDAPPEPLERITMAADAGDVHQIRLVQRGDRYAFEPAEVVLPPGDVVRFVMTGSQPESVAFDTADVTPEVADFIRRNQLHLGVLLTDAGQTHDVPFTDAPPGRYPFVSLPHGTRGMRGSVLIQPAE
ncbi:MAG: plastocyanin/azurin family copper-binding protein [Gemmatimonadota bacterium]